MSRRPRIVKILLRFFWSALAAVSLSVAFYLVFAMLVSTREERRLARENRQWEKLLPSLEQKANLLEEELRLLQVRDDSIYFKIYETTAPELVWKTETSSAGANAPERIDALFEEIYALAAKDEIPPLSIPIKDFSPIQTGASTGMKLSPVFKVRMEHGGLDMVAPQGTPVLAAGDGTVTEITHGTKGLGNIVEVTHKGGYVTRYCILDEISVRKGSSVSRGSRIGTVGIYSAIQAAHLHFEVLRDGVPQNPVHYFFASLTPKQYTDMLYISSRTTQSLD